MQINQQAIEWAEFEHEGCEYVELQPNGTEIRMTCGPLVDAHWWEAHIHLSVPFVRAARLSVDGLAATAEEARAKCEAAYPILQAMATADTLQQLFTIAGGE